MDDYLVDDPAAAPPRVRLLVPTEHVSVEAGLLAVLRQAWPDPVSPSDLAEEGFESLLSRFAKRRHVFKCALTSSMVSGEWGLGEFVIGARGYLYDFPDTGVGADESLPILGAWEPADDPRARLACIRAVHAREWSGRGWPPYVADEVEAPAPLLFDLLLQSLEREPGDRSWVELYARTTKWLDETGTSLQLRTSLAASSHVDVGNVSRFVSLMAAGDPELPRRLLSGTATPEEQRVFAALATRAIHG